MLNFLLIYNTASAFYYIILSFYFFYIKFGHFKCDAYCMNYMYT